MGEAQPPESGRGAASFFRSSRAQRSGVERPLTSPPVRACNTEGGKVRGPSTALRKAEAPLRMTGKTSAPGTAFPRKKQSLPRTEKIAPRFADAESARNLLAGVCVVGLEPHGFGWPCGSFFYGGQHWLAPPARAARWRRNRVGDVQPERRKLRRASDLSLAKKAHETGARRVEPEGERRAAAVGRALRFGIARMDVDDPLAVVVKADEVSGRRQHSKTRSNAGKVFMKKGRRKRRQSRHSLISGRTQSAH